MDNDNINNGANHHVSKEDLQRCIYNEGIGYGVMTYYGKVTSDDKTAELLWNQTYDSIKKLEEYLK